MLTPPTPPLPLFRYAPLQSASSSSSAARRRRRRRRGRRRRRRRTSPPCCQRSARRTFTVAVRPHASALGCCCFGVPPSPPPSPSPAPSTLFPPREHVLSLVPLLGPPLHGFGWAVHPVCRCVSRWLTPHTPPPSARAHRQVFGGQGASGQAQPEEGCHAVPANVHVRHQLGHRCCWECVGEGGVLGMELAGKVGCIATG
jgi:hypothetical protein